MKVTDFTRKVLAVRREHRELSKAGYRRHETDWEIHRGFKSGTHKIADAIISVDGVHVYTKIGPVA